MSFLETYGVVLLASGMRQTCFRSLEICEEAVEPRSRSYSMTRIARLQPPGYLAPVHCGWLKNIASPTLMLGTIRRTPKTVNVCIFRQRCVPRLNVSFWLNRRPFKGHRSRAPASRGAEKRDPVANQTWLTGALHMCQYGIDIFQATRWYEDNESRCRTDSSTGLERFPVNWRVIVWRMASAGTCRAILSRVACFTDKLTQHTISTVRFAQIRSNNTEFLFVSKWSKPLNRFSNSVSAIENAEDLCQERRGPGRRICIRRRLLEKIFCSFGAKTSQRDAKRLPISRASDDLD